MATVEAIANQILHQNLLEAIPYLPVAAVDLLILDPPYNRRKQFNDRPFHPQPPADYQNWFEEWFQPLLATLKPTATIYVCADWQSSTVIYPILARHLRVQNRITWEREKGRGAKANWKNSSEDIWFCTQSSEFYFDVEAVKLKRRVMAPYRDRQGQPKDWQENQDGRFRVTHPSNLWTDISVPFWSMPENTDHPTQKPEKLIAKLVLASSRPGDLVLDPFLGSGTTAVVAKKLGRRYVGIEIDQTYCCLARKRLDLAEQNPVIQGYTGGYFWDRNTSSAQGQAPQ
ncbi:site-specific DNA-methyltransferase [filamentous cyanobacterium CCP5]|nr:site-specific DNA-methyltransferase [filamentous cyanobacterium CCP5]